MIGVTNTYVIGRTMNHLMTASLVPAPNAAAGGLRRRYGVGTRLTGTCVLVTNNERKVSAQKQQTISQQSAVASAWILTMGSIRSLALCPAGGGVTEAEEALFALPTSLAGLRGL